METDYSFSQPAENHSFDEKLELLAYLLTEEESMKNSPAVTPLTRRPAASPLLASSMQRRFWFLEHFHAEPALYTIPTTYSIHGELDIVLLEQCLNRIMQRHDILRTTFTLADGECVPLLHSPSYHSLPLIDLYTVPEKKRMEAALHLISAEAQLPFDLITGPLLRTLLVRLDRQTHIFLLAMHHSIADGESVALFLKEMAILYKAGTIAYTYLPPPLPIQYADFAYWQHQILQNAHLDSRLQAWKQYITTDIPVLALPTDYPQPAEATFRGALLSLDLPPTLVQQLQTFSKQEGVTLFMLLLAAFQLLLYRYTEQNIIIVGSPISGRTHQELENLLGCFTNTTAIRTDMAGNPSFLALLANVQASTLEAYSYQDIPFEQLVESLQAENASLFQVMFTYETMEREMIALDNLLLRPLAVDTGTAKFALTLFVLNKEGDLTATIEYNTDLFAPDTISRMLKHFQSILSTITSFPTQRIRDFSLISPQEVAALSSERPGSTFSDARSSSVNQSVAQAFETQVKRSPQAPALLAGQELLTYQQLNERANQLARLLLQSGIGPEIPVALFFERSIDLVISMLAVLKAGAVYVPLDTDSPCERLSFILQDCCASLVLSQRTLLDRLPHNPVDVLCIDTIQNTLMALPPTNLPCQIDGQQLAYCIYTSGSTGTPKGVQVAHTQLLSLLTATQSTFTFGPADAWTLFHSPAFDFSVWEIWGALLSGGRLVIVPYWVSRSPQEFWQLLLQQRITILNQTPSAFRQLVSFASTQDSALRLIIFGGEALNSASLQPWFEQWGDDGPTLVNMYGITETTVHVTQRILQQRDLHLSSASPIGQPLSHQEIYLLDPYMQLAPPGITGEIYVGGMGLARGYSHLPDLTAERFVPHPFSTQKGARLYKSGDLARQLPSGELIYLGRVDHQIKIRGFRIEPGEIEHVLCQHPSVLEAVVWVTGTTEHRLVAYLVVSPGSEEQVTTLQMRSYLLKYLPEHMVPATYVLLEHLPLTTNHKIDYKALPQPENHLPVSDQPFVAPQTANEQTLAEVWQQVLLIERVGLHDNFFALGGDSIRSIQILARAKQQNLHFSLQQLFQHPTIYALSRVLQQVPSTVFAPSLPITTPFSLIYSADRAQLPPGLVDAYPLTMLQTGMLYHMQLQPDTPTYHNVFSLHIRAFLNMEYLQAAIQQVIARHPLLRTSFDLMTYSEPLQLVHQSAKPRLTYEKLYHCTEEEQEKIIADYITEEKHRSFDLATPPLVRFHIHQRSASTFQFTLTEIHAILDGWSLMSTLAEIFDHYHAALYHQEPPPSRTLSSTLTTSFRDFVAYERAVLQSEEHRRYWQQKLSGYTFNRLANNFAPDVSSNQPIHSLEDIIPREEYEGLHQLATRASVPLKSVLLAIHLKVMSIMSGQSDVLTGLTCEGRPEEEGGEQIRGLFLNTVPLRQHLQAGSWFQLIKTTFRTETELLPFRHYPLAAIQRDTGGENLFETLFTYLHFHAVAHLAQEQNFAVISTKRSEITNFTVNACFSLYPLHDQLSLLLDADAARFSKTQFETLAYCYRQVLHVMVNDPASDHTAQSFLPYPELQNMLVDWNSPLPPLPETRCLHHLFEEQAARTPDAIALICWQQTLTYHQLNAQANQLAHFLHYSQIGPDMPVAVCLERSPALLVCLLAILKAGGCYVPLDPHTPPERLVRMVEDTQAPLLLTQHSLLAALPPVQARILCLEQVQSSIARFPADIPPSTDVQPDNLAYIIFTSGSTGQPKGVMVPHMGLVNYVTWAAEAYDVAKSSGSPLYTSLSFDLTVTSLFPSLIVGKPVILLTEHQGIEDLVPLLRQQPCSPVKITPAHLTLFEQIISQDSSHRELQPQTFVIGGETLRAKTVSLWQRYAPTSKFINEYGPTETSVGCCIYQVSNNADDTETIPIGRPTAHTQLYVLDSFMQPTPRGVCGELYIGGPGLARGYLSAPELTAERFLPDPFSSHQGARLYKTGDLVRLLPDGNLDFLGRLDQQVKIRGFRVELDEIAAALVQYPAVQESVVICKEAPMDKKQLIAYCVLKSGDAFDENLLQQFLRNKLPAYMLPTAYVILEKFPLTAHGKIDRTALPFPDASMQRKTPFIAPQTPLEQFLSDIWGEVLHLTEVGIHDNFFTVGGDSLSAMQVVSRLRAELQVELSLRTFLEHPTIAELIALLDQDKTQQERLHKIAYIFQTIANLSDDEVQIILSRRDRE